MNRLIEYTVFSGLRIACRRAIWPTRRSPVFVKPTTEGVRRVPSALGMTVGSPPIITAITELVVPRSMPTTFAIPIPPGPAARRYSPSPGLRAGEGDGVRILGNLDLYRRRPDPLRLRNPDLENPILVRRLRLTALDLGSEREGPRKRSVPELPPVEVAALLLLLVLPLALERDGVVRHGNVDLLGIDVRQFRPNDDLAVGFEHLGRRLPDPTRDLTDPNRPTGEDLVEQLVHRLPQGVNVSERIPPYDTHLPLPPFLTVPSFALDL